MSKVSLWAGLDTGEETSRLSVVDAGLDPVFEETLPSQPDVIAHALRALGDVTIEDIALEGTGSSHHIARGLRDRGFPVSIFHAAHVSRYLQLSRNKTDINDARGLAALAKLKLPSVKRVHLKSQDMQRLRARLLFRHRLTVQRMACEGMIRSLIRLNGGSLKSSSTSAILVRHVREALARLREDQGIDLGAEIDALLDLAASMRRFLERIERDLNDWARRNPVCARLLDIPGVGPITAISFYTAIEDPWRFADPADVGAYLGLAPQVIQSGTSLQHRRISKKGDGLTRAHLVNAATSLFISKAKDSPLRRWGLALAARVGRRRAAVAAARRLAVIMLGVWRSGGAYDYRLVEPKVRANGDLLTAGEGRDPEASAEA